MYDINMQAKVIVSTEAVCGMEESSLDGEQGSVTHIRLRLNALKGSAIGLGANRLEAKGSVQSILEESYRMFRDREDSDLKKLGPIEPKKIRQEKPCQVDEVSERTDLVLEAIRRERLNGEVRWSRIYEHQVWNDAWLSYMMQELGIVLNTMNHRHHINGPPSGGLTVRRTKYAARKALVRVAAVLVAWIENMISDWDLKEIT